MSTERSHDSDTELWSTFGYETLSVVWSIDRRELRRLDDVQLRKLVAFTGRLREPEASERINEGPDRIGEVRDRLMQTPYETRLAELIAMAEEPDLPSVQSESGSHEPREVVPEQMGQSRSSLQALVNDPEIWSTLGYDALAVIWNLDPTVVRGLEEAVKRALVGLTTRVANDTSGRERQLVQGLDKAHDQSERLRILIAATSEIDFDSFTP